MTWTRESASIKRPQVQHLLDRDTAALVPQMLLDEAETLEILRKSSHPDIVPYHGCIHSQPSEAFLVQTIRRQRPLFPLFPPRSSLREKENANERKSPITGLSHQRLGRSQ